MQQISRNFLWIALGCTALALFWPAGFRWIGPWISWFLGLIMFGMGLTIEVSDFRDVWRKRQAVLAGAFLQYTIMPLAAFGIGWSMKLPVEVLTGMVIVGSCPGGTASNVIVYLSKGNVPLSVTLTLFSTVLAPFLTPGIIYLLLHKQVEVPVAGLYQSVLMIVVIPLGAGTLIRTFFRNKITPFIESFPAVSVITISLVIGCVVALNRSDLLAFPGWIILGVILHNATGLSAGYGAARILRYDRKTARTLAVEVGMQNSGLGVALAKKFFGPLSALPGAVFSLWHNISGILLAKVWSKEKN